MRGTGTVVGNGVLLVMARLLGPLRVEGPTGTAALGGVKQRAVLAQLLLRPGHVVGVDHLLDVVWGEAAGDTARHTLQVYVSNLRRGLRAAAPDGPSLLERAGDGYRMALTHSEVDVTLMAQLATSGRQAFASGQPALALDAFETCLGLWRGPALADFPHEQWARAEARRLDELRLGVTEDRIEADLALGRHAAMIPEIEGLVHEHPMRERLRGQLMLALYRDGRQADALDAYRAARRALMDAQGVEPGPHLRALHRQVLDQDPALTGGPVAAPDAPSTVFASLRWVEPGVGGHTLELDPRRERYTIGRVTGSDVHLHWDHAVSRAHAEVTGFGSGWAISDEGLSRNGTMVDGVNVTSRRLLVDGDEIVVGATVIRFTDPGGGDVPPTVVPTS